jgi:hypothetical protein
MADQTALKFLGFAYAAVAVMVALTALVMVLRDIQAGSISDGTTPRAAIARAG